MTDPFPARRMPGGPSISIRRYDAVEYAGRTEIWIEQRVIGMD